MNWKRIFIRALIIALAVVAVACIAGAGDFFLRFLFPPRVYYVIGAVIIVILLKILFEIRNKKEG